MDIQQLLQQIFGGQQPSPNLLANPNGTQARVPNLLANPAPQPLPQDQFGSRFAGVPPQPAPQLSAPVNVQEMPVAEAQPNINDQILGGIFAPSGTPQPANAKLGGYFPPAPSMGVDTMQTGSTQQSPMTMAGSNAKGLLAPGNIDLAARPVVKNNDGSVSTVRSISFQNNKGQEVLIPTVADDGSRILSNQEAMEQYGRTGKHLGIFDNPDDATAYAKSLHNQQEQMYVPQTGSSPAMAPGSPGEIRSGPDGKNYQYAQTTGMAGATGDQGWIPTSQKPSGGGVFGSMVPSGFKDRLGDMMLGWGMGGTAQESLAMGNKAIMAGNLTRKEKDKQNQTIEWLKGKGYSQMESEALASNPSALTDVLKQIRDGQDPRKALELRKLEAEVNSAENPAAKMTTDEREYERAKSEGFTCSFTDYQIKMKEAGRNQVNIETGVKLPAGFRWKDPNNQEAGVEPIPGGPGDQIPAELAARIGMADSFLGQFDKIKEKVKAGEVTGVVDRFKAANTSGVENETYRQVQSGADALLRMLTGAGMPEAEARSYAERYLPTYRDTAESAASKLDQLKRELESASSMAMRGRGGFTSPAGDASNDPLGIR